MNITKATIVLSEGWDVVCLSTDLPSAMPNVTSQNAMLKLDVAKNSGEAFVKTNFPGVPIVIVPRYEKI
jgi:hypothetical protein